MQGASCEFMELVAICKGDSFDESNNLTHAEAVERAKAIIKERKNMALNITKGKIHKGQKIIIYGEAGVGKTTLASQFPNPLFGDAEDSTRNLDVPRVNINDYDDAINFLKEVKNEKFDTIVIDTVDWLENATVKKFEIKIQKNNDYGRSYIELKERFTTIIDLLNAIVESGKNVVLLAHNMLNKIELPDELGQFDRHEMKLTKQVKPLLTEWADAVLFMYRKVNVEISSTGKAKATGGKQRRIIADDNSICIAKNRWGLTSEIDADIKYIAPFLVETGKYPAEPTPKAAEPMSELPPVKTPLEHLEGELEFIGVSKAEFLQYLYTRGKVAPGTNFEEIPEQLINTMLSDDIWPKIEKSLKK